MKTASVLSNLYHSYVFKFLSGKKEMREGGREGRLKNLINR